jgi:NADH-quinone oxidoreductase subunit K
MPTDFSALMQIQILAAFLFFVGVLLTLLRRSVIVNLLGIELMLNAANISLVAFSNQHHQVWGQIGVLCIIVIAAAETAVGISILINLYRHFASTRTDVATTLKG